MGSFLRACGGTAGEETCAHSGKVFVHGYDGTSFAVGFANFFHAGESPKKELGEVAEGDGLLAVDAFEGKLFGDVGEQGVDFAGGAEVAGLVEKIGGLGFRIRLQGLGLPEMVLAEPVVAGGKVHAATTTARVYVIALIGSYSFFRHDDFLSKLRGMGRGTVERTLGTPPLFCNNMIPWELAGGGALRISFDGS